MHISPLVDAERGITGIAVSQGESVLRILVPVQLHTTSGASAAAGYEDVRDEDGGLVGRATIVLDDGVEVAVEDRWTAAVSESGVTLERRFTPTGGSGGVRYELVVEPPQVAADQGWQYFVSGALYNRNDTDCDGREDYLGTYRQEYRDDRNGHLAALAFAPAAGTAFTLSRTSVPTVDHSLTVEELESGAVISDSDIGSLGVDEDAAGAATLRAAFPFVETRTFALDTSGRGWAGFVPAGSGRTWTVTYRIDVDEASDLTEAIWQLTAAQRSRLNTRPTPLPLPLPQIEDHRFELVQQYFHSWSEQEDERKPAGYLVHFSPREGRTLGGLLEFGFTGAQSLLALASLRRGNRENRPEWADGARQVIDFFVDQCVHPNGFAEGLYDTVEHEFVSWFTGILMPFNYSQDEEELRGYLGKQLTEALAPIAAKLRSVPGNYTRTMCEAVLTVVLAYEDDAAQGVEHPAWLAASERFGDFLLAGQNDDGSWYRGYDPDGRPLYEPTEWFGKSALEQRSGTMFAVSALEALFRVTDREEYRAAALRGADFIVRTYVDDVLYCGGLNDTAHVKSVKIDSTGVLFAMRALIRAHRLSGDDQYLRAAVKAAKVAASWLFLWDVPFPQGTLLADADFRTTGWAVCDAIPAGSYVEDVFLEFIPDLAEVAVAAREPELVDIAELVMNGMQQGVSLPGNMLGYAAPGIQCEGYMTSYWLSAPDETKFSGAVGKRKGDDNDTCNGFTNGAALYGLDTLREGFGTTDLREIRQLAEDARAR